MEKKQFGLPGLIIFLCFIMVSLNIYSQTDHHALLTQEFNLTGKKSPETQYYILTSELTARAANGKQTSKDVFRLFLKYHPGSPEKKDAFEYECVKFIFKQGDSVSVSIPALENWRYHFLNGIDEKGQVFGIDHTLFENLTDQHGVAIPPDKSYHVYNAFIDFHSFCNVFADSSPDGKGIQDLQKIGQKIVHAAAFSEPPVNLGSNVARGSYFKNGEITLEFKGLSVVNGRPCALIGYDSGESSFKMTVTPAPEIKIQTTGGSHYQGDIYKDLKSGWVGKVTMQEIVVSETSMPMPPHKINAVTERLMVIQNVNKNEFLTELEI